MRLQQHQQHDQQDYAMSSPQIGNERQSADPEGHHRYEQHQSPAVLNYASSSQQTQATVSTSETGDVPIDYGGSSQSLFVVIPRIEYDFMKQELAGLRHTLNELKNTVSFEIHQLKVDGKALKQRVDACLCSNNVHHGKVCVVVSGIRTFRSLVFSLLRDGWTLTQTQTLDDSKDRAYM